MTLNTLGSVTVAAVYKPGGKVGKHLSDITQLQLISITAMRQLTLLEEHVYRRLDQNGDAGGIDVVVNAAVKQMTAIAESAASKIETYAEPAT